MMCALLAGSVALSAHAKELDQFTDRVQVRQYYAGGYQHIANAPGPAQVDAVLDARMNQLLDKLLERLREAMPRTAAERDELVRATFQHPLLPELVTPYEEWVKHEAPVPLYKVRDKGMFGQAVDYDDMRMTWYIELSPIVQVAGVLIGIDKLGHFLAQGYQYYVHYRSLNASEPLAARLLAVRAYGHGQEVGQLGIATGGVYSFADLASNWAGMEFHLALFEAIDLQTGPHARYFERAADGMYRRVRDFHWAEWITPDWDEVLNPAGVVEPALYTKLKANFARHPRPGGVRRASICDQFRANPQAYLGAHSALRPRSSYALARAGSLVAPYAIDVQQLCGTDRNAPDPARPHGPH